MTFDRLFYLKAVRGPEDGERAEEHQIDKVLQIINTEHKVSSTRNFGKLPHTVWG